jgi:prevent-host-death family protein
MSRTVGAYEAKTKFSELLNCVEAGEEIIITRRDKVVARLVPERDESSFIVQRDKRLAALSRIAARVAAMPITRSPDDTATPWDLINEGRDIDV